MALFRTTADIADEVLQKSGEPTNGASPYEAQVITYLNKVHQAIVGGGSIHSLNVDEPWTWARSKHPITLNLLPPYTFGTISIVAGESVLIFSDAPAISLDGWFIQCKTQNAIYKITQHTASTNIASIDSEFIGASGTYAFRAFKLDYDLAPSYLYVSSHNDRLDFQESTFDDTDPLDPITTINTFVATLTHGTYSPTGLLAHMLERLNTLGASTYTGSYDPVTRKFTITSDLADGSIFSMLGATGTNRHRSVLPLLGYDLLDYTAQAAYTSSFMFGGISRLVEPFKVFSQARRQMLITSNDPIGMDENFPLSQTRQMTPTQFAKIAEDNLGNITVRFNSYPSVVTKVVIDWIPIPIDLQDNDASIPLIPRKDIDCLIHGASMFILFDKEDSKWETMLNLTKAALEAMQKKNRSELFRTGENFGQIVPRQDYVAERKNMDYGYAADGPSGGGGGGGVSPAPTMITAQLNYPSFAAGATTSFALARILPAGKSLHSVIVKHNTAFAGPNISAVYASVGIPGEPDKFISNFLVSQAVTNSAIDSAVVLYYPVSAQQIIVTLTAVGNNLNALTQGSLDIYLQEQVVNA